MTADPAPTATWNAGVPCPRCYQLSVMGYRLDNEHGGHMHTHYVCTFWAAGTRQRCGWSGWFVPGWDKEED